MKYCWEDGSVAVVVVVFVFQVARIRLKDRQLVWPADTRETGKKFEGKAPVPELPLVLWFFLGGFQEPEVGLILDTSGTRIRYCLHTWSPRLSVGAHGKFGGCLGA